MRDQLSLDYDIQKLSRRTDPPSSTAAAKRVNAAGQRAYVLKLVSGYPGLTAKQYDALMQDEGRWNRIA